jgi:hypothetical protein
MNTYTQAIDYKPPCCTARLKVWSQDDHGRDDCGRRVFCFDLWCFRHTIRRDKFDGSGVWILLPSHVGGGTLSGGRRVETQGDSL